MSTSAIEQFLAGATVDPAVYAVRPDYHVCLIAVDGLVNGPSNHTSDAALAEAEAAAREALKDTAVEDLPHLAAWRDAYRGFGAKPQRTRSSVEALMRRADSGLPRINRVTDIYNAVSVLHQIPLGGEDLDSYDGAARLVRATGAEPFATIADGAPAVEYPEPGEIVWCDGAGVTCRRWNWRQSPRTRLREETTAALFILDALSPLSAAGLAAAADDLGARVQPLGAEIRFARRVITSPTNPQGDPSC